MSEQFFITGTDTGVGKTIATLSLMHFFKSQGKTVIGFKPVASGCKFSGNRLINHDAYLLRENSSLRLPYEQINPYAYREPISPHIAGRENPVDLSNVRAIFSQLSSLGDLVFVEGAGGWKSPLSEELDNSSLAIQLNLPVIMIVGIRLGCINHARLTFQAIAHDKRACVGWIANCMDRNVDYPDETIAKLRSTLPVPCLGVLPFNEAADFKKLAERISIPI